MPNTKSGEKALRQANRRYLKNSKDRVRIKEAIKSVKSAATPDILIAEYTKLQSLLDKAAKTGVIHANKAARLKSRLYKAANATVAQRQNRKEPKTSTRASKSK